MVISHLFCLYYEFYEFLNVSICMVTAQEIQSLCNLFTYALSVAEKKYFKYSVICTMFIMILYYGVYISIGILGSSGVKDIGRESFFFIASKAIKASSHLWALPKPSITILYIKQYNLKFLQCFRQGYENPNNEESIQNCNWKDKKQYVFP